MNFGMSQTDMSHFKPVSHVIFDLDGTLVDTEQLFTSVYQSIAERYGKMLTWKMRAKCLSRSPQDTAAALIRELQLPITVQEMINIQNTDYYDFFKDGFENCQLMPGVDRLVKHLHAHNIPLAIGTSCKRETYDLKSKNLSDVFQSFHHVVCRDDHEVLRTKPAPDIFQVCCKRFENAPSPEEVLVIEDGPSGVQAALAAGMQVVVVPDSRVDLSLFENATLVLKSLNDFKPDVFGLPPFPES